MFTSGTYVWLALTAVAIIVFVWIYAGREDFATKSDKANAISEWFATSAAGGYVGYKKAVSGSDIVEYEKVRTAISNGATASQIARII